MDVWNALKRRVYYLHAPISYGRGDERRHARLIRASISLAKWAQANNSRAFPSALRRPLKSVESRGLWPGRELIAQLIKLIKIN